MALRLYDLVLFPWERLLFAICALLLGWWLFGKISKCQTEVLKLSEQADYILRSPPCNEQRDIYSGVVDCDALRHKLDSNYHEEVWWSCFLNTFMFYRSWMGIAAVLAVGYAVFTRWQPRPEQPVYYAPPRRRLSYDSHIRQIEHRPRSSVRIRPWRSSEDDTSDSE
jgi:hypothetical protein